MDYFIGMEESGELSPIKELLLLNQNQELCDELTSGKKNKRIRRINRNRRRRRRRRRIRESEG
jgi:hypothetical protein